jgi:hypothetical protein
MDEPTGRTPASDVMLTMTPSPEARRCGAAARTTFHGPITLTRRIFSQISGVATSRSLWGMTAVGARVVDDDVEPAVVRDGSVDEALGLRRVRDVCLHVDRIGQLVGHLPAGGDRRGRVDDDSRAEVGDAGGDGRPDAARRTRDESDSSLQIGRLPHDGCRGDWSGW